MQGGFTTVQALREFRYDCCLLTSHLNLPQVGRGLVIDLLIQPLPDL
jgi:hypothetical protein